MLFELFKALGAQCTRIIIKIERIKDVIQFINAFILMLGRRQPLFDLSKYLPLLSLLQKCIAFKHFPCTLHQIIIINKMIAADRFSMAFV